MGLRAEIEELIEDYQMIEAETREGGEDKSEIRHESAGEVLFVLRGLLKTVPKSASMHCAKQPSGQYIADMPELAVAGGGPTPEDALGQLVMALVEMDACPLTIERVVVVE